MKKSKIFAAMLFLSLFAGMFAVVKITSPMITASGSSPVVGSDLTTNYVNKPLGDNGTYITDLTSNTITLDGDLTDWDGAEFAIFDGINVSVGYDASYVYVACAWVDSTNDDEISHWNKTGMINATHAEWTQLDGADDVLSIGFSNGTYADFMTWAASIRGDATYAYEHDDAGDKPFIRNIDATGTEAEYTNTSGVQIGSHPSVANGTIYVGWFDQTPTGSQADTELDYTWNDTGDDQYIVEFRRLLDTGNDDDIVLDFSNLTDMTFWVGGANGDAGLTLDQVTSTGGLKLSDENEAATLTFDTIENNDTVDSSLLITGTVYDDYEGYELIVYLSGWADTYGAGVYDYADINLATGNWSYLFLYNADDMPTGAHSVHVELYPLYEDPIMYEQDVDIQDNAAPEILGLVDLGANYPDGVLNDTTYVTVTVGLRDNYDATDDIVANLYSYKDDGVALQTPMTQFSAGGTTFSANITISLDPTAENVYTYFVDAWDTSNNKVLSEKYTFKVVGETVVTPGFGIIAALIGLTGASFIIFKRFKK